MKRYFLVFLFAPLIFISSCSFSPSGNAFYFYLHGTWVTDDDDLQNRPYGTGSIEIGFNTIRIEGFHRQQLGSPIFPPPPPPIPFENFARGYDMPGYSENNMLVIQDVGHIRQIQYFTLDVSRPMRLRLIFSSGAEVILGRQQN